MRANMRILIEGWFREEAPLNGFAWALHGRLEVGLIALTVR